MSIFNVDNMNDLPREVNMQVRGKYSKLAFTVRFVEYSSLPCIPGFSISSPKVQSNGSFWWIDLYPGGADNSAGVRDFVACHLRFENSEPLIMAYSIILLSPSGKKLGRVFTNSFRLVDSSARLHSRSALLGSDAFLKREEVFREYCHEDTLSFLVEITIFNGVEHSLALNVNHSERSIPDIVVAPPPTENLLFNAAFSDVTFQVQNERIPAHQCIICSRSDVFRKMFDVSMREKESQVVKISDFPAIVVRELLRFLYTNRCNEAALESYFLELLTIATMYQVEDMRVYLESHVHLCLNNADSWADFLIAAEALDNAVLRNQVLRRVAAALPVALSNPELRAQMTREHCLEVLDIIAKVV